MAVPVNTLAWIRSKVGDTPDDATIDAVYTRLLSDQVATAREILDKRLANYLASPASFSVSGEYSQSVGDNIRALQEALNSDAELETGTSGGLVGIVPPPARPYR